MYVRVRWCKTLTPLTHKFNARTHVHIKEYGSLIGKVSESLMPTCPGQPPPVQLQAEGNLHWGVYAALVSLLPFYFVYIFGASMTKGKVKHYSYNSAASSMKLLNQCNEGPHFPFYFRSQSPVTHQRRQTLAPN